MKVKVTPPPFRGMEDFAEVVPYTNKINGNFDPYVFFGEGRFAHISTLALFGGYTLTLEDGREIKPGELLELFETKNQEAS